MFVTFLCRRGEIGEGGNFLPKLWPQLRKSTENLPTVVKTATESVLARNDEKEGDPLDAAVEQARRDLADAISIYYYDYSLLVQARVADARKLKKKRRSTRR